MAKTSPILAIENRIAVVREYATLWQRFFTFFADDLRERQITQQEETEFSQIVSILAINHYKFQELAGEAFKDASKVVDVLFEAVNLAHIKSLPDASYSKLQVQWHTLFIGMHKALGKLLSQLPPKKFEELQARQAFGAEGG